MTKVVINADDFGKTSEVNQAIDKALDAGAITSSTILANTKYWEDIHRIVNSHPDASFGVHLNLTEGESLTKNNVLVQYGITDDAGIFTGKTKKINKIPQDLSDALFIEITTQIHKVKTIENIPISHIDGHHHVHALSVISDIILKAVKENGINRMRNRYHFPKHFPNLGIRSMMKDIPWKYQFVKNGIKMTKYFGPYQMFVEQLKLGNLPPKNSTIELMCHPGHNNYCEETDMVFDRVIEKYLNQIEYINYTTL